MYACAHVSVEVIVGLRQNAHIHTHTHIQWSIRQTADIHKQRVLRNNYNNNDAL